MVLKCLGSSSAGNTYLLESEYECLVLEAGIKFAEVKKALDFNISKIAGVIASHQHGDHFSRAEEYLKNGFPVYAPEEAHKTLSKEYRSQIIVRPGYWYHAGQFEITPFEVEHDVQCYGYIIRHPDSGILIFATDTAFIRQNFKSIKPSHIMIECNYSEAIINERLMRSEIEQSRVDRVLRTHMALETCKEFVKANQTAMLDNVVLLHLSDGNSNAKQFQAEMQEVVGKDTRVWVADKGMEIRIDMFPW